MKPAFKNKRPEEEEYVRGILNRERVMPGKAITLVEAGLILITSWRNRYWKNYCNKPAIR